MGQLEALLSWNVKLLLSRPARTTIGKTIH